MSSRTPAGTAADRLVGTVVIPAPAATRYSLVSQSRAVWLIRGRPASPGQTPSSGSLLLPGLAIQLCSDSSASCTVSRPAGEFDTAAVGPAHAVGQDGRYGGADVVSLARPAERDSARNGVIDLLVVADHPPPKSVAIAPGISTLTRMYRAPSSCAW